MRIAREVLQEAPPLRKGKKPQMSPDELNPARCRVLKLLYLCSSVVDLLLWAGRARGKLPNSVAMLVYAVTILTGAFLLFQVPPLIVKYILPWFGGGLWVWTNCMLFCQVLLLGGCALDFWFRPSFGFRVSAFGFANLIPPKTARTLNP
jgi:hypothetical protein